MAFSFWRKRKEPAVRKPHPGTPVIRCSICTGEQVAGFRHEESGRFEEVMLLRSPEDLERFRQQYGITGAIEKIYCHPREALIEFIPVRGSSLCAGPGA